MIELKGGKTMERKYVLSVTALAMIAILGVSFVSAGDFGFGKGFMNSALTEEERTEIKEQREAIRNAIESGDYAAWESLMQERLADFEDKITQSNFEEIMQRHQTMSEFRQAVEELKESGDFSREAVDELREEYGIEAKGPGKGFRMGKHLNDCPLAE